MTLITKNADGGVTIDITKIRQPDNLDEKVWRYINLPKLIAFLRMETLCFIQASELKDQHEGTLTRKEIRARDELIQVAKRAAKTIPAENDTYTAAVGQVGQISQALTAQSRTLRDNIYINCWCMGPTENQAMWNDYGKEEGSVVLQSTYRKLKEALSATDSDNDKGRVTIGQVEYEDYNDPNDSNDSFRVISYGNLDPIMRKRCQFAYEQEIRCLRKVSHDDPTDHVRIDVRFIETVRVRPTEKPWIYDLIKGLVSCRHSIPVLRSDLDLEPRL